MSDPSQSVGDSIAEFLGVAAGVVLTLALPVLVVLRLLGWL